MLAGMGNGIVARPRWSPDVIEMAYQLWARDAGQNVAEVRRRMTTILDTAPPENTIREWSQRDGWRDRWKAELRASTPVPTEEHVQSLSVAAVSAVKYLSLVAAGTVPYDKDRVAVNQYLETAGRSLILAAAKQSGRGASQRAARVHGGTVDLSTLTPSELYQLEQQTERDPR